MDNQENSTLLCYYCRQTIAANDPICEGLHPHCFCQWFNVRYPQPFEDLIAKRTEQNDDEWGKVISSFFHGKFRKYSARLGARHYLLKVQEPDVPELPATEYLCNQIAHLLGLAVPNHFLIRLNNTLDTFVSENFVEKKPHSNLIHIYRFLPRPELYTCEGLLTIIQKLSGRYEETHRFIDLCLFDALTGNHDRHGRNIAILQSSSGMCLAPFYDNPTYLAIEDSFLLGAQHEPRGAIATKSTQEPTMTDYVIEWKRLGFNEEVQQFFNRIDMQAINQLIDTSFISQKRQKAIHTLIKKRYGDLQHALYG